jgi:predicted nucleic acid-binding protein
MSITLWLSIGLKINALMQGHRQITDAYLIMLAKAHGGYLATMDRKIANALRGSEYEGFVQTVDSGS